MNVFKICVKRANQILFVNQYYMRSLHRSRICMSEIAYLSLQSCRDRLADVGILFFITTLHISEWYVPVEDPCISQTRQP